MLRSRHKQHLSDLSSEAGPGVEVPLQVDLVEPLGDRMDVTLRTPSGHPLVARVAAHEELRLGTKVSFFVRPPEVHLFEPGPYGRRLAPGTASTSMP